MRLGDDAVSSFKRQTGLSAARNDHILFAPLTLSSTLRIFQHVMDVLRSHNKILPGVVFNNLLAPSTHTPELLFIPGVTNVLSTGHFMIMITVHKVLE